MAVPIIAFGPILGVVAAGLIYGKCSYVTQDVPASTKREIGAILMCVPEK